LKAIRPSSSSLGSISWSNVSLNHPFWTCSQRDYRRGCRGLAALATNAPSASWPTEISDRAGKPSIKT
jgi:hypothetical protein